MKRFSRSWLSVAAVLVAACGPHRAGAQVAPGASQDPYLPPVGFGSLRQDAIGVILSTDQLRIRVIPLDEHVIRLLSPDSYRSLHDMAASRATDIRAMARGRGFDSTATFMVTFFGVQPQARFSPDDLTITSQGTTYRAIGYVAITPRFSENIVDQREQAAAIYVFEPSIVILRPITVTYGPQTSDTWEQSLELLNTERARVLSRASSAPPARP